MIKLPESLIENNYVESLFSTPFTILVSKILQENRNIENYKSSYYIHASIKYPQWTVDLDIFQYIHPKYLFWLQQRRCFFVFDCCMEGYSPIEDFPFFEILYRNCEKYHVDPSQIIYVSANMKDDENLEYFCKLTKRKKINIFSFLSFEIPKTLYYNESQVANLLENEKEKCKDFFETKYFSSLNRRKRMYRAISTFLLCQETFSSKALISHDAINEYDIDTWFKDYDQNEVRRWAKTLPLTIDYNNFDSGHLWVDSMPYSHIHHQTLFQLVNETYVETKNNTGLFFTEKTFKPIEHFQPFIIYGCPGSNHYFKNFGYKIYDDWFDYSFDYIEDHILRYKQILSQIKEVCSFLDTLSFEDKIEWRFKNSEILIHNYKTMKESMFNKVKLKKLFDAILK
jgi:hypothetical protein